MFINFWYLNILMKIIKAPDKKVGDTQYWKFILRLPLQIIEKSGLLGKELKAKTGKNKIVIEKK